ncbi:carboxymuconolactone decarboxylase family protein [Spongisporangium articulatum]|uniref:Carboxymuconolactone decarboxylase family protein n=1 Tax=Spongisporangium articulatum TaxID=3362603 RepID=A0ABW8AK50_9ACTN
MTDDGMPEPRIRPGTRAQTGFLNWGIARFLGRRSGTVGPPNIFTTVGRHRWLYRWWLLFAATLMPGGKLRRRDTELVILRVGALTGAHYERFHHVRLGRMVGLSDDEIERTLVGSQAPGWTPQQLALMRATEQLHATGEVDDDTWAALAGFLDERRLIEFCFLVGHYEMVAMMLKTLRVREDEHRS